MKNIAVTQRVELVNSYGERRDAIDRCWTNFLLSMDLFPVFVSNELEYAKYLVKSFQIDGVLLTGGNSLARYGGNAPERDEVEYFMMEWAIKEKLPVLGVCRGMQIIQEFFGNELTTVVGHVATRHSLIVEEGTRLSNVIRELPDVNAYHNFGAMAIQGDLRLVARSLDGVVMAVEHVDKDIFGVMWHSEREKPFRNLDRLLFKQIFFNSNQFPVKNVISKTNKFLE